MSKTFSPHILAAHAAWRSHLRPSDTVIDMTCGNGHDTRFLAEQVPSGTVIGFDIQKEAIDKTTSQIQGHSNVRLIHGSHTGIDLLHLENRPRLIVYNLGYLPGGDKTIVTQVASTLESLENAMKMVAPGGAISITCYPGHEEGAREEEAILEFLKKAPSHEWLICHHRWINRPKSPSWLWIVRSSHE